ncbi:unnamed protein product [Caenorhabditis auriculariae]|uniref:Uncharacterized protein n=1 Tax=Caenorhabditis auriculariae TaxID=2777116 RepID=A0A8S1HY68_9PELO|nr:unnamed protein product [Caenorhabditis auriculariae]
MMKFLLILLSFSVCTYAKTVQIRLRENVTQTCPNVDSDLIDESSLKISMKMLPREGSDDDDSKDEKITFPGCYRVKMSFRMKRTIHNPYIEAFMQLGQNMPCRGEGNSLTGIDSICTNITTGNWCPKSHNSQLRDMLIGKQTCQFCHLCDSLTKDSSDVRKIKKFVSNDGPEECSTEQDLHTYSFKMCTPTRDELNEDGENRDKLEEYWQYLKQGIMTTVIHVMDRQPLPQSRSTQCQRMCDTLSDEQGVSDTYRQTLRRSIENMCAPVDAYAACLYHTVKFDLNSDL